MTTQRTTRIEKWSYFEHPLTVAQVAFRGKMACLDTSTGLLVIGAISTTLRPIGTFDVKDNVTGDGVAKVRVKLFKEIFIHWFDNDGAGTPVVVADIGSQAFILDDETVSGDNTGRSAAGRVWAVNASLGVAIEAVGFAAD